MPGILSLSSGSQVDRRRATRVRSIRDAAFYTTLYPKFTLDAGDHVQLVLNGAVRDTQVTYGASAHRPD
jgi:hypothetical protein